MTEQKIKNENNSPSQKENQNKQKREGGEFSHSYSPEESRIRERIVRIMQKDIEGGMEIYPGLTKIKGISWSLSNAICKKIGMDETKKIGDFLKNPDIPKYLKNRQKDFETGEDEHLTGSNLELKKDFDIKRLKKIKSYKGYRHVSGLPVRGQRTRAHFRKNRKKAAGIKKKRKHKLYSNPKRPFDKKRIDEEKEIKEEFGLKNKKEIWKAEAKVKLIRKKARNLIKSSPEQKKRLFDQLNKIGLKADSLTDAFAINIKSYLERRLQTVVFKKRFANTIKEARQKIVHKKQRFVIFFLNRILY